LSHYRNQALTTVEAQLADCTIRHANLRFAETLHLPCQSQSLETGFPGHSIPQFYPFLKASSAKVNADKSA
jgi:hypothetical protein